MNNLRIYTVNYPLAYMAERIGGEHASVIFPAPGDVDPAFWQPEPEDILAYQRADLILLNGAGYANWLARASLPTAGMVDTSVAYSDRLIGVSANVRHKHGPEGDHSHGDVAFTTWLDPDLAAMQAQAIHQAMAQARPELAAEYNEAYDSLISDLEAWDKAAAEAFAQLTQVQLIFSHPVYQYLQRKYRLTGQTLMWEPDEPISLADIGALADAADTGAPGRRLVIWEAEPLAANRDALQALGYESVVFNPLANRPESGDYLTGMAANIDRLNKVRNGKSNEQEQ
ncbi:MAG: zinc ABC transporter substrate-binding protein [Gammaproteobacteria bacterium]|nr:MAG: zinc ABC transporter substrate-binding protein [Gammaproteobacteria bacterium]